MKTLSSLKPTLNQFGRFQFLFDHFNEKLFNGELKPCLLNLSRKGKNNCGHFSPERWQDGEENPVHEININPLHLSSVEPLEVCQTIVHEMCHQWQHDFGKPSRGGYHNKEWGNKMEEVGLMPSNTGSEGGKKTGQQMSDYPIEGGNFLAVFDEMTEEMFMPLKSIERPKLAASSSQNKKKYTCLRCDDKLWGKPNMTVPCGRCISPIISGGGLISEQDLSELLMIEN